AILDPSQPRVFHAPGFFRTVRRIGDETRAGINAPIGEAVVASSHGEVRMATAILDADEQDGLLADLTGAGVEDRVGRVRPVPGRQYRVGGVALEQLRIEIGRPRFSSYFPSFRGVDRRVVRPGDADSDTFRAGCRDVYVVALTV